MIPRDQERRDRRRRALIFLIPIGLALPAIPIAVVTPGTLARWLVLALVAAVAVLCVYGAWLAWTGRDDLEDE